MFTSIKRFLLFFKEYGCTPKTYLAVLICNLQVELLELESLFLWASEFTDHNTTRDLAVQANLIEQKGRVTKAYQEVLIHLNKFPYLKSYEQSKKK